MKFANLNIIHYLLACFLSLFWMMHPLFGMVVQSYSFTDANVLNPGLKNSYNPGLGTVSETSSAGTVLLQGYGFGLRPLNSAHRVSSVSTDTVDADIVARVEGIPLVYPNPFTFSDGGTLQYKLSKNMNIEIVVFDFMARELLRKQILMGRDGAMKGYNNISISAQNFHIPLSAGVYLFFILSDGQVMAKGKFAVRAG